MSDCWRGPTSFRAGRRWPTRHHGQNLPTPPVQQWQAQLEVIGAVARLTLLLRGAALQTGSDSGYVVVFDDISDLLQAQRDAAWGGS